jgi:GalNAc-alpha-(1->4)-GalNAc-alpha-(1->3)-diNAcBac-PP-undecaprenol alpha-1,4-N-acetyl-D-galactosaminyltransferase
MNVGIVLPYLKSRGTELQALRISEGLIRNNVNVVLFVIQGWGDTKMYNLFKKIGVKVVNVGKPNNIGEKHISFIRIFSLIKLIYINKCELIINRATLTSRIAGYAGRFLFVPVSTVLSGCVKKIIINKYLRGVFSIIKFILLGCPSKIISVSLEGGENFKKSYPLLSSKVYSIQNGVEVPDQYIDNYYIEKNKNFVFCFSGSLDLNRKGIDILLYAIHLIIFTHKVKNVSLVLIGSGKDLDKISKMSKQLKIEQHVKFSGEVKDPISKMLNYNAFVLPSRREGMPNALLEAMSIGIPCIASDCNTGPREIISNNKNGLLVPSESSIELANSMVKIYSSEKLRRYLGVNARKTIKKSFLFDKMIKSFIDLLGVRNDK